MSDPCRDDPEAEILNDADQLMERYALEQDDAVATACTNAGLVRELGAINAANIEEVYPDAYAGHWLNRDEPTLSIVLAVVEGTPPEVVGQIQQEFEPSISETVVERPLSLQAGRQMWTDFAASVEDLELIGGSYDPQAELMHIEIGTDTSDALAETIANRAAQFFVDVPFEISRLDGLEAGLG